MVVLSVDLGHVRTGLALSDKTETLASSLCVIEERDDDRLTDRIARIAQREKAELIVVGLPRNMDGSEGESAQRARRLAEEITGKSAIPTQMQDERGTTITAHAYLSSSEVYGKKRKKKVDAVAASIILQNYLDSLKQKGTT